MKCFEPFANHSSDSHHEESNPRIDLTPQIAIFTTLKPNVQGPDAKRQEEAMASWVAIEPRPRIILQGCDPLMHRIAHRWNATVDCGIDVNFRGVPLFHSMIHRALQLQPREVFRDLAETSRPLVVVIVNADVHLPANLPQVFARLLELSPEFFAVAARWDVDELPLGEQTDAFVRDHGTLHTYGGIDLFAWSLQSYRDLQSRIDAINVVNRTLTASMIPSFVFGRGKYDNWLFHEVLQTSNLSLIVDITESVTLAHVRHSYRHVPGEEQSIEGNFWTNNKRHSWEAFLNVHLALAYGSYQSQQGTTLHAPYKMVPCLRHQYCVLVRKSPARCRCEYSNFAGKTQSEPAVVENKWWRCGHVSREEAGEYRLPLQGKLAHTLDELLHHVADPTTKVVVMTAATYEYRFLLMNWICNLRMLRIHNVLVAALDEDLYRYAFARGLAVYLEPKLVDLDHRERGDCPFGSSCFRQRSKLKSRHVYEVLQRGYHVLWSDVDVTWFQDVRTELLAELEKSPANASARSMWFQSNEPDLTKPWNGLRRLNSGFYFMTSTESNARALARIIEHGAQSTLSEQPSFYDVLCGERGEFRLDHKTCFNGQVYAHFLDPNKYWNGANWTLWTQRIDDAAAENASILHNNWVVGLPAKTQRIQKAGLVYFDPKFEICLYNYSRQERRMLFQMRGEI
ncbi:hypothetical protein CCYA_CCYA12G3365 [Cyanidiococcus yangmingshanensis]|nr:hypothetical protein CCYA_CCYA12G3365 [Cyanidiococcus yangmingshanensis]